jgi:hypothetical protein
MRGTYSVQVNSKWNILFRKAAPLAFAGIALFGIGCGGLGASGSISPASFLLPGIGHHDSQKHLQEQDPSQQTGFAESLGSPQVAAFSPDPVQ